MRQVKIVLLFSFLAINAFAQSNNTNKKTDNLLYNNLKKHIEYLASDALEGRRTGTPGEMKAVTYISSQYQKMNIKCVEDKRTYIQLFNINEGKEIKKGTSLKTNGTSLKLHDDYWPFPFCPTNSSFKGHIYYQETKAQEPWLYNLKMILDSNKNNPHFDLLKHIREQTGNALLKGASALLVYNTSTINDSLEFSPRDKSDNASLPVIYLTKKGIKKLKEKANIEGFINIGDKIRQAHNVIAYIDNGAPTTVIIGGHLDHLGYGEDHNSRYIGKLAIHNGADDNASGTSAVIELARILKEKSSSASFNKNNYCFIHFSGEELGLFGSKYFTEHSAIDMEKINYMINLDMIGRLNDSTHMLTIGGVGTSGTWGEIIKNTGTKQAFNIKIDSSGTGPSDHESFYRKNIPVLFFFTGLHNDYHKPSDDADKINYQGEAAIIDYIIDLIAQINEKGKLAFTKTREQPITSSRFKVSIGIMPDYTYSGQGVKADGIVEGKAAQKAGLKAGDIIIQLGEHKVTDINVYMQALKHFNKGENTKIIVKRDSEMLEFSITF